MSHPDRWYFGGDLEDAIRKAAKRVAAYVNAPEEEVCLLGNATDATTTVLARWSGAIANASDASAKARVLSLNWGYRANKNALQHYISSSGGHVVESVVPFPMRGMTNAEARDVILQNLERTLVEHRPKYALLEHIHSQPAILLPLRDMIKLCREKGVEEIAVDAAHAVGSVEELDIPSLDVDFYYSNLHKWGAAPHTATLLYARRDLMTSTVYPVVSWHYGEGLKSETQFSGTRDYSALIAAPHGLDWIRDFSSLDNQSYEAFNHHEIMRHVATLSEAWGTEVAQPEDTIAGVAMVELPKDLIVDDVPGTPTAGVRSLLRDRYHVEAALGNFGIEGNFVRLSHNVYNTERDYSRLRDAVLEILDEQRHAGWTGVKANGRV